MQALPVATSTNAESPAAETTPLRILAYLSAERAHSRQARSFASKFLAQPRVLLLDDDADFRELAQQYAQTRSLPFSLDVAAQVSDAPNPPDSYALMLVDFMLGKDSGIDVARDLARRARRAPVLIISGKDTRTVAKSGEWPRTIRGFVPKSMGLLAIFDAATNELQSRTARR